MDYNKDVHKDVQYQVKHRLYFQKENRNRVFVHPCVLLYLLCFLTLLLNVLSGYIYILFFVPFNVSLLIIFLTQLLFL